jgi:capsular polysaccharide biosynthesis protein
VVFLFRPDLVVQEVSNARVLISMLRRLSEKWGRALVIHENGSLVEQVYMFQQTDVMIGTHGAGLTNILYCQPGAHVVELLCESPQGFVYACMAAAVGLTMWSVLEWKFSCYKSVNVSQEHIDSLASNMLNYILTTCH